MSKRDELAAAELLQSVGRVSRNVQKGVAFHYALLYNESCICEWESADIPAPCAMTF